MMDAAERDILFMETLGCTICRVEVRHEVARQNGPTGPGCAASLGLWSDILEHMKASDRFYEATKAMIGADDHTRTNMAEPIPFTERRPLDAQTVTVFCDEWSAPKVMIYRENWNGHGSPRLLCESDGRHYWHPERMTWRPHFELKAVS